MSAIQVRVNRAIEDAMRADTALVDAFVEAGGQLLDGNELPVFWLYAPPSATQPFFVYGPQVRETETEYARCGEGKLSTVPYEVRYVVPGIKPLSSTPVVDALATALDGLSVDVDGLTVHLLRAGDFCYPELTASETAETTSGLVYRAQVQH